MSTPPEGDDPRIIGASLERLLGHMGAPAADTVVDVFERWSELVGPDLGEHTRPLSFTDGVLTLAVDDPVWASHLRWAEEHVLQKVRRELGSVRLDRLDVRMR